MYPRRQKVELPSIEDSMELIYSADSTSAIHTIFKQSCKLLKDNEDAIAEYWMSYNDYDIYNQTNYTLLAFLFAQVGLRNELVKDFLDTIKDRNILSNMGVVRVKNHYRIRTGLLV
jgi:hypothetical protein